MNNLAIRFQVVQKILRFDNKIINLNSTEIEKDLIRRIDSLDQKQINELTGLIENLIHEHIDADEWAAIPSAWRDGIFEGIKDTEKMEDENTRSYFNKPENASIAEEEIFEWSTKTIYNILLTTTLVGNYNFTNEQKDDIITIANLCPLQVGKVVYTARGLWQLFDSGLPSFNDVASCLMNGYLYKQQPKRQYKEIIIYPNPANKFVTISLDTSLLSYEILIRKLDGQLVYQSHFDKPASINKLDVSNLKPGLYIVELKDEKSEYKRTKLVIE